jgi:hypothetical protein
MDEKPATGSGRTARSSEENGRREEVAPGTETTAWGDVTGDVPGADAETPGEYVAAVTDLAAEDPVAAGDRVGDLLAIAREHADTRPAVEGALDLLGWRRPEEFAVWSEDLAAVARADAADLAAVGMAALADLGSVNPRAAATGVAAALDRASAGPVTLRQAALAVLAEVGDELPGEVRGADRHVATALNDDDAKVRQAGAMAAGRLLAADPGAFPRTASSLFEILDDDAESVREYAVAALAHFATSHPATVPEKERATEVLAAAEDEDLGLRAGTTNTALAKLLAVECDRDLEIR